MADIKEQSILQAALEIFAAKGFERATMDEIAVRAGVAKGTLFYRYQSKEELFISLIRDAVDRFTENVSSQTKSLTDVVSRLKKSIEIQTRLSYQHPKFAKLLLSEVWGKQERQRLFRESLNRYLQFLRDMIDQGIEQGELRITDSALLATSIFGMTAAASLHLLVSEQELQVEHTIEELQNYMLKGILV